MQTRNYLSGAAFGSLTATVALLAGLTTAGAQTTNPPAPGGGAFPGSFLVPGTDTSIAIHGRAQLDFYYDASQRVSDFGGLQGLTVEGPGVGITSTSGHLLHGNWRFRATSSVLNFETRTPTGWGEVKTFVEMDWAGSANTTNGSNSQYGCCVEGGIMRVRHVYGTLGPFLFGQTTSLFADTDAFGEVLDGSFSVGVMGSATNRRPQLRYTYLGPMGTSFAGSLEQKVSGAFFTTAPGGAVIDSNTTDRPGFGIQRIPAIVVRARIDQPWGHAGLEAEYSQNRFQTVDSATANFALNSAAAGNHVSTNTWAIAQSGHFNTIGKDKLAWTLTVGQGVGDYSSDSSQVAPPNSIEGMICHFFNKGAGSAGGGAVSGFGQCSTQRLESVNANYQHWWTDQIRTNIDGGYATMNKSSDAAGFNAAELAVLEGEDIKGEVNLKWSPVPQVDFGVAYIYWHRRVLSGAVGVRNEIATQFIARF